MNQTKIICDSILVIDNGKLSEISAHLKYVTFQIFERYGLPNTVCLQNIFFVVITGLSNANGVVMRKSAINNSLLDLTDSSEKMARRGSVGSLDSGMSISFQSNSMFTSNNHNNSHQCSQNRNQRNNGSGPPQQPQNSSKQH